MADAFSIAEQDDGQSIPSALAATPASRVPRKSKLPKLDKLAIPVTDVPAALPEPVPSIVAASIETVAPDRVTESVAEFVAVEPEPVWAPEPVAPVVATPLSTPTAAVPAAPQKESIMATTIENVTTNTTAKAQAFFADANERAKGAVAKSTKMIEEATAFSKGNVEALVESSKIVAKGFETIGQDAAEFSRKQFEEATAAFKTLASVKSPTEFMKLQSDFVRSSFDAMVAETSRSTETVLKLAGEVAQPISNRIAVAAEKMKTAA